jgi:hypothetical protein
MPPHPQVPESRDLFVHLGEQLIAKLEAQPITITYVFSDGELTVPLKPGDPLYKLLAERRAQALRCSLAKLYERDTY